MLQWILMQAVRVHEDPDHLIQTPIATFREIDDAQAYARFEAWAGVKNRDAVIGYVSERLIRLDLPSGSIIYYRITVIDNEPIPEYS